jgi:hypothetical protein
MGTAHHLHAATLLDNGTVLITGSYTGGTPSADAEIFVPATNSWVTTRPLNSGSSEHSSVLLPNGQVLITGWYTTELYIPFQ